MHPPNPQFYKTYRQPTGNTGLADNATVTIFTSSGGRKTPTAHKSSWHSKHCFTKQQLLRTVRKELRREMERKYVQKSEDQQPHSHEGKLTGPCERQQEVSQAHVQRSLWITLFSLHSVFQMIYLRTPSFTQSTLLEAILEKPRQTCRRLTGAHSRSARTLAVIWNSSCSFSSSWVCWMLEPVEVCVDR